MKLTSLPSPSLLLPAPLLLDPLSPVASYLSAIHVQSEFLVSL